MYIIFAEFLNKKPLLHPLNIYLKIEHTKFKRLDLLGQAFLFAGRCGHRPLQIFTIHFVGADAHIRPLKQCGYIVNQSLNNRRHRAADNNRVSEHLGAES